MPGSTGTNQECWVPRWVPCALEAQVARSPLAPSQPPTQLTWSPSLPACTLPSLAWGWLRGCLPCGSRPQAATSNKASEAGQVPGTRTPGLPRRAGPPQPRPSHRCPQRLLTPGVGGACWLAEWLAGDAGARGRRAGSLTPPTRGPCKNETNPDTLL